MKNDEQPADALLTELAALRARIAVMEAAESDRRQAETALRAAKEEWEQSFNALTDDVFILDTSGRILRANKAMQDRFTPLYENLVGLDYRLIYYGTVTPPSRPPWEAVLSGALSVMVEIWLPKLQGWYLVSCYPLYDVDGRQWGAASVVKDVTERKRVEEVLRDIAQRAPAAGSVAFFRSLVTSLAKALDVDYILIGEFPVEKKDALQTIAVYARGAIQENFLYALQGSAAAQAIRGERCCYVGGVRGAFPQDRQLTEWEVESYIGSPLFNSIGQPVGVLMAMDREPLQNVRLAESILGVFAVRASAELERKRTEEALRDSEERYRAIVENTYDLICETTQRGEFLYLSPNFREVLGYEPQELRGRNLYHWIHPADVPAAKAEFERAIESGKPGEAVFRYLQKNGEWRWFESTGKALHTATGEIRIVVVSRDITERKKIEEERLRASKLESVGVLAGGIAHDFNNLLTAIVGYLSLAKMSVRPGEELYQRLADAEKASLRAKGLTQQLLTFAKGGVPIKRTISIAELLKESASLVLRGSHMRCEFSLPADLWPVEADEGQISQVVNNLVINAQEAMPDGGVTRIQGENATIRPTEAVAGLTPGRYVKLSFRDEGGGIAAEHLPKIFDPYFTTKEKGSGLGLATCYSIIKNHEGAITVESQPGEGTTFRVYLPAGAHKSAVQKPVDERLRAGRGKILVMDDEEAIRELLVQMLAVTGYTADVARDGAEAIELYQRVKAAGQPFDAVIMDLTVPGGMDGKEAVRRLSQIDPHIKAIVSSGYANDPVMAEYKKYGFKGMVTKPFKITELSEVLHVVLSS